MSNPRPLYVPLLPGFTSTGALRQGDNLRRQRSSHRDLFSLNSLPWVFALIACRGVSVITDIIN